jgi:hypothetical protein
METLIKEGQPLISIFFNINQCSDESGDKIIECSDKSLNKFQKSSDK